VELRNLYVAIQSALTDSDACCKGRYGLLAFRRSAERRLKPFLICQDRPERGRPLDVRSAMQVVLVDVLDHRQCGPRHGDIFHVGFAVPHGNSKWGCAEWVKCGPNMVLNQLKESFNSFAINRIE